MEVAKELERTGKASELRKALEIKSGDANIEFLLNRWRTEMLSAGTQPRPSLLYHLARIGLRDIHTKSVHVRSF